MLGLAGTLPSPLTPGTAVTTLFHTAPDRPWHWHSSTVVVAEDTSAQHSYACVDIHAPGGQTVRTVVALERLHAADGDGWGELRRKTPGQPYPDTFPCQDGLRFWRHRARVVDAQLMAAARKWSQGAAFRAAWHHATGTISVGYCVRETGNMDFIYLSHEEVPLPDTEVLSKLRGVTEQLEQSRGLKRSPDVAVSRPMKKPAKQRSDLSNNCAGELPVSALTPEITAEILSCLTVGEQTTYRRVCATWDATAAAGRLTTVILDPKKYLQEKLALALYTAVRPTTQLLVITNGTHEREFDASFLNVVIGMLGALHIRVPCIVLADTQVTARDLYVESWRKSDPLPWSTVCRRLLMRGVAVLFQQRKRDDNVARECVRLEDLLLKDYGIKEHCWDFTECTRGAFTDVLGVLRIFDGIRRFNS
ncbi:uncharacterized protein LOC129601177 [Paramacrobiotus metropolitanus]|uniref:uncharacterized protein LOC129601177 n=1 Tax=Paramacrobiotus metropolitanus TaxID=2943436 RepID=UPI00244576EE|nr:uncharacterized protein LOC129601177 [Paramacrobiotus metropolitanus]XP_055355892.1 uncharacterized protein LOC129601177 [Paramacrobiotus metropolitanus]